MYTPLDVRQPMVMLWLPCLWLIKMHEAQAGFLEQLVADSTTVEETRKIKIIRHPTSSLQ
jgi:uncharacterized membrane protein